MSCERMKVIFAALLYDEISREDLAWAEEHIVRCEVCAAELKSLRGATTALSRWTEEDPGMNLLFVSEKVSLFERLLRKMEVHGISIRQLALGTLALAFLMVVFTALLKTEATYRNGRWNVAFGSEETRRAEIKDSNLLYEVKRMQEANLAKLNEIILASEERQRQQALVSMGAFAVGIDKQRREDLQLIDRTLNELQNRNEGKFNQTNQMLDEIYRLTSYRVGSMEQSKSIESK